MFQGAKDHRGTEVGTSEAGSHPILRVLTHALSAVWGGLEAGLTQTVEGALCVDTTPSQTWVCGCTLVNILASGAPLSADKTGCTEAKEGPLAVEALAMRSAMLLLRTLVHIFTHGAIDQLEALGTETLVGTFRVLALASEAAVLGTFTLIDIFTGVAQGTGPVALLTVSAGKGAHSVGADSCGADSGEGTFVQVFTGSAGFVHPVPTLTD